MDSASQYLSTEMPDRADHLWRYTPWKRIHPTGNTKEIPTDVTSPLIGLVTIDGSPLPPGIVLKEGVSKSDGLPVEEEITKSFLEAVTEEAKYTLSVDPKFRSKVPIVLEIETVGSLCSAHICLEIGKLAELELVTVVRGDCEWFGLLRTGSTGEGALASDIVVNLLNEGRLLRIESISIPRNSQFKAGTVSS